SADIQPGRAMLTLDLTSIDLPDEQFDVIFCSHVLEHIPDDKRAMEEMYRVLRIGGTAYIQVPIGTTATFEDLSITDPEARSAAFGQADHVRLYGTDIIQRLAGAGFSATFGYASDAANQKALNIGNRPIIICEK